MGAGREPAWAVLAWQPWRPAFCSPFFTGCPVFPSLGAVTGPAVCPLLYGAHPFVAGMHQALSGPVNSPTGFREPCCLGSGFGNWTKCFKAPTSQHLLKTQILLFFLTEVSYSGFRILPCVSPQSCLFLLISVPTTQVPGTVLSLLGGGSGFPACPPFVLSFFSVASSMRASQQLRDGSQSRRVLFQSFLLLPTACRAQPCALSLALGFRSRPEGGLCPLPQPPSRSCTHASLTSTCSPWLLAPKSFPSSGLEPAPALLCLLLLAPTFSPGCSSCTLNVASSEHSFLATSCRRGPSQPCCLSPDT